MDCSAAAIGLLMLVVAGLALAALLQSRTNAAAVARLGTELARLRELLDRTGPAPGAGAAAAARGVETAAAAAAAALPRLDLGVQVPSAGTAPGAVPQAVPAAPAMPVPAPSRAPGPAPGAAGLGPFGPPPAAAVTPGRTAATAAGAATAAVGTPAGAAAPPGHTPRRTTFEELVGARLLVWVGAMALALAGAFLVKISFERGWISPPIRVAMGVAFGIGLLGLAESLRRSSGRIAEALSAAGIADLFACFLAAVHLYHLVPPAAGFLLMALTTAVAVALALRQGIMVALLGLTGGFLTPALIQTSQPSARNLFGYLLLLTAGLLAVAWRRGWRWLGAAALGAGLLWVAIWLAGPFHGGDAPWLSVFLIALAIAATLPPIAAGGASEGPRAAGTAAPADLRPGEAPPAGAAPMPDVAGIATAVPAITAALVLLAATVSRGGYSLAEWGFLWLLAAGVLALAWLDPRYLPLAWVAGTATAALLAAWGAELQPDQSGRFLMVALVGGGLFALTGWVVALAGRPAWRCPPGPPGWLRQPAARPGRPGQWASLSAAAGVAFFLVAWGSARAVAGLRPEAWGGLALAAAALYLAGALPMARRRHANAGLTPAVDAGLTPALAALSVAVTSLVSISVPLALRRDSCAAAWALEAAALAWLAGRFCLPALVVLARLLAPVAVLGAFFSTATARDGGELPPWLELLYVYGTPLLALAGAAWLARRPGPLVHRAKRRPGMTLASPLRLAAELEWLAVALLLALVTLEIHQLFTPAPPTVEAVAASVRLELAQMALVADAWLLLGWALLVANRRLARSSLELAGRLVILAGLAAALAGSGLAVNPLWNHQRVGGTPLLNVLAAAYALPAMLAVAGGAEVRRHGGRRLPPLASAAALLLGFAWISLTVRQLFHGTFLDTGPAGAAERYAYSAAWVLYGVALLLTGIARRGPILRYGSLAVMLLAVAKVFLYDTARLSDLYRVLSFLGLGASLLLLGFLYQRFVFRPVESVGALQRGPGSSHLRGADRPSESDVR
jgi:uncharacterized membrane protein